MDDADREAVKRGDEELIPAGVSDADLTDEMNRRSCKSGLTTRYGECPRATKIQTQGYGDKPLSIWPRDEHGNLIED